MMGETIQRNKNYFAVLQAIFFSYSFWGFLQGWKNVYANGLSQVKICMPKSSCLVASVHVELQANVQFQNCRLMKVTNLFRLAGNTLGSPVCGDRQAYFPMIMYFEASTALERKFSQQHLFLGNKLVLTLVLDVWSFALVLDMLFPFILFLLIQ